MKHLTAFAAASVLVATSTPLIAAPLTLECTETERRTESGWAGKPWHKSKTVKPAAPFYITIDISNQTAVSDNYQYLVSAEPKFLDFSYEKIDPKSERTIRMWINRETLAFRKSDFLIERIGPRDVLRLIFDTKGVCKKVTTAPANNQI